MWNNSEDMAVVGQMLIPTAGQPAMARLNASRGLAMMRPTWVKNGTMAGAQAEQEDLDPLPFVVDELDHTHLTGSAIAFPQRPFRGERLLMSATLIPAGGSPSDVGNLVFISPAIYVGAAQVGSSQGDMPISTYAGGNFGVRLSFPEAGQGTRLYVPFYSKITPDAGDVIVVTCTVIGRAVR